MIPKLVYHPDDIFKVLPIGIHYSTLHEVEQVYSTNPARARLYDGLVDGAKALAIAGCKNLYLDGSYVSSKRIPGDFDACWDLDGVNLNVVDRIFIDFSNGTAAQKQRFYGEFFPSWLIEEGSNLLFLDFFQSVHNSEVKKGIVWIDLQNDPLLRSFTNDIR